MLRTAKFSLALSIPLSIFLARESEAQEVAPTAAPVACTEAPAVGRWYFQADAIWLRRSNFSNKTLSILDNGGFADDRVALSSQDAKFDYQTGLRFALGATLDELWSVEMVYFGVDHSARATSTVATNTGAIAVFGSIQPYWADTTFASTGLFGPAAALTQATTNPTLGFTNSFQHSIEYSSQLHNVEFNLRRTATPNASALMGFRYINLNERLDFISIDQNPAVDGNTGGGVYSVDTDNHLFGFQIGGEYGIPIGSRVNVSALGKAGVFMNAATQSSTLFTTQNNTNTPLRTLSGSGNSVVVSTVLEFGVNANWRITDFIALRGGYNFFFINGVATAPDNLAAVPFGPGGLDAINTNGNVLFHGPSIGLEIRW